MELMEPKIEENTNIFLTSTFDAYSFTQRTKYKIFMTNMLRLARETNKNPEKSLSFEITNNINSSIDIFTYSIELKKWLFNGKQFNPTAVVGLMEFLDKYKFTDIENIIDNYSN